MNPYNKMRKALKLAINMDEWCCAMSDDEAECVAYGCVYFENNRRKCPWKKIRSALASKPRNCDIGTTEEQNHRFNEFCKAHKELVLSKYRCSDDCPCLKTLSNIDCAIAWSNMPYSKSKL